MHPYKYLGWKGTSNDDEVMNFALSLLPEVPEKYIFKHKENRIIYKFSIGNTEYFAKLNRPNTFYHKFKTLFFSNSYFEFKSAMLVQMSNLSVVKASGWCSKGFEDMIVTENPGKGFVEAGAYWETVCQNNSVKQSIFLCGLAEFVRKYIGANLYHRDFHLGNLLMEERDGTIHFMLIDPLGIRRKRHSSTFNSGVLRLIGILKSGVSLSEKVKFFMKAGIIENESEFESVWARIIYLLSKHENRKWFGRRPKILKGKSRYSEILKDKDGLIWLVRKGVSKDDFGKCESLYLTRKKAKKYWLYSCFLQSHGIDHRMPVAWIKKRNGKDLLLLETAEGFEPLNETIAFDEFMSFCTASSVKIADVKADILLRGSKPCLVSSDPEKFNQNIYFF
ncbi:MAG: hypothetical protein WCR55_01190 [Lentisphaerota bacterium]